MSDQVLRAHCGVTSHEMNAPIPKRNFVWAPVALATVALENTSNHLPMIFNLPSNPNLSAWVELWVIEYPAFDREARPAPMSIRPRMPADVSRIKQLMW